MATRSFAVIGLGQFGRHLALTLSRQGVEVLVIDTNAASVAEVKEFVARAVRLDCTQEDALRSARVQEVQCAVLALGEGDFEATALAVANLCLLKVPHIVARTSSAARGRILELVGATRVVFPEIQAAEQMARTLLDAGGQAEAVLPPGYSIGRVTVPASLVGRELREAELLERFGMTVVAIRRPALRDRGHAHESIQPLPAEVLLEGDTLVVAGRTEQMDTLSRDLV